MVWPTWAKCVCCWKEEEGLDPLYQYGYKEFILFPCLHVVCATGTCFQKVFGVEEGKPPPSCPECSRTIPLFMVDELKKIKPLEMIQQAICTSCIRKWTVVSHCKECDDFFCANCTKHHKFAIKTCSHVVADLSEIPEERSRCKTHFQILDGYCTNCDAPLCAKCLGSHGNCEVISMEESFDLMAKNGEGFEGPIGNLDAVLQKLQSDVGRSLLTKENYDFFGEAPSIQTGIFDILYAVEQWVGREIRNNYKVSAQMLRLKEIQCSGRLVVLEKATKPQQLASMGTTPSMSANTSKATIATSMGPRQNLLEPCLPSSMMTLTPPPSEPTQPITIAAKSHVATQMTRQSQPNFPHHSNQHQEPKQYAGNGIGSDLDPKRLKQTARKSTGGGFCHQRPMPPPNEPLAIDNGGYIQEEQNDREKLVNVPAVERLAKKPTQTQNLGVVRSPSSTLKSPAANATKPSSTFTASVHREVPKVGNRVRKSLPPVDSPHPSNPVANAAATTNAFAVKPKAYTKKKLPYGNGRYEYTCNICGKSFKTPKSISGHCKYYNGKGKELGHGKKQMRITPMNQPNIRHQKPNKFAAKLTGDDVGSKKFKPTGQKDTGSGFGPKGPNAPLTIGVGGSISFPMELPPLPRKSGERLVKTPGKPISKVHPKPGQPQKEPIKKLVQPRPEKTTPEAHPEPSSERVTRLPGKRVIIPKTFGPDFVSSSRFIKRPRKTLSEEAPKVKKRR